MTAMTVEATARGEALFRELQWVHGMVRRDLATVERLDWLTFLRVTATAGGMPSIRSAAGFSSRSRNCRV